MLSRLLPKTSNFGILINLSSKFYPYPQNPNISPLLCFSRFLFNGNNNSNNSDSKGPSTSSIWNLSRENDGKFDELFTGTGAKGDGGSYGGDEGLTAASAEEYKPWRLVDEVKDDVFDHGEAEQPVAESVGDESSTSVESVRTEEKERELEMKEKELTDLLEGKL